jgi:hypothetical protein
MIRLMVGGCFVRAADGIDRFVCHGKLLLLTG